MWHIYSPSLYHFSITEELLDLIPMKGTTTGEDFMIIFEETFEKYYLQWDKLVSIATDHAVEEKSYIHFTLILQYLHLFLTKDSINFWESLFM